MSALKRLERSEEISADWVQNVQRRFFGWPWVREELTQARYERVWELRHNFSVYDAAYLAVTESLSSTLKQRVALVTADQRIQNAPPTTHSCEILVPFG